MATAEEYIAEQKAVKKANSVVQISAIVYGSGSCRVFALKDNGSIWSCDGSNGWKWTKLPDIPKE